MCRSTSPTAVDLPVTLSWMRTMYPNLDLDLPLEDRRAPSFGILSLDLPLEDRRAPSFGILSLDLPLEDRRAPSFGILSFEPALLLEKGVCVCV